METTLTGTQLNSALAPASSFPGFTVNTKDTYNAGDGLTTLATQYNLTTMSCPSFSQQMIYATWFGQTSIAWEEFDGGTGGQSQTYDEFIYQFADPGTASSFVEELRSAFSRCHSYTDVESGVSTQTTYEIADAAPVGGGQAMQVIVTASGASVGAVAGQLLYVLSRNNVYGVIRAGPPTAVPASPAASAVIGAMMTHVRNMNPSG
jgi:hypothetical protein